MKDYREYMSLAEHVKDTGVVYIGGGVPKDWIQLISVTADLLYNDREIPNRQNPRYRDNVGTKEAYYPHSYAVQITTDSPQWGGLSGCTFEEAVSWGKSKALARIDRRSFRVLLPQRRNCIALRTERLHQRSNCIASRIERAGPSRKRCQPVTRPCLSQTGAGRS